MTLDRYLFDDLSYARLDEAGVKPFDVQLVLHGEGRMRRHVGTIDLLVAGQLANGRWLWVWLSEMPGADDTYVVRDARYTNCSPLEGWI